MDIFCWNIRGFNDKIKRRGFRKWMRSNNPIFGGLVETHVSSLKAPSIIGRAFSGWQYECNYEFSDLGKIWVIWHPSVRVSVIHKSLQAISCRVRLPFVSEEFVVTFVYGSNCRKERRELWSDLSFISSLIGSSSLPWITLGDFNQVRYASEHSTSASFTSSRGIREFNNCLAATFLADLPYCGNSFTWTNNQGDSIISKKLDRILVNDEWFDTFPNSLGVFGDSGISDHSPCCVFLDYLKPKQKKPFKFFSLLNENPEFAVLLTECWNSIHFSGSAMFKVSKKLKELKSIIRTFSRDNYSGIENRVKESFAELLRLQNILFNSPSPQAAADERKAHEKWSLLAKAEESFLYQRSRVTWLDKGDMGSAFFHRSIRTRQGQNQIILLLDDNDAILETRGEIMQHAVDFFEKLLGGPSYQTTSYVHDIAPLVSYQCPDSRFDALAAPFTREEIQKAFFSLPRNKSPGPDGYPAEFFTANWKVVGPDMINAVTEFFVSGKMLQQWNATILTLIPKKQNAVKISDFRPISCCNTAYKVIAKLLAARLKQILPDVISNTQSAFIPGRLLLENVLMATELVQGYNWKNITKRSMLKVDLKKAFDSLNWSFIISILQALRLPPNFINLISQCITTTRFSVAVNGELGGYFRDTKGLRQGDPLSPYLFVLAMEVLAQMLNSSFNTGLIGYHPAALNPPITHLAFADDVMIFFDGQVNSLQNISLTLDRFSAWSGLSMNRSKTELFVAGLSQLETNDLSALGFSLGSLPIRYLGLPLMHRKLQICDYRPLIDQLKAKFTSWTARALSFAGRRELLSSVIHGTITFWFSTFLLPKGCIKSIESLCCRFLWNGNISERALAKVAWKTVCLPKAEGGLGLRDLSLWNKTLCLKLVWLLFSENESLWAH